MPQPSIAQSTPLDARTALSAGSSAIDPLPRWRPADENARRNRSSATSALKVPMSSRAESTHAPTGARAASNPSSCEMPSVMGSGMQPVMELRTALEGLGPDFDESLRVIVAHFKAQIGTIH